MIPRYKVWNKAFKTMYEADNVISINFEEKEVCVQTVYFEEGLAVERDLDYYDFDDIVLMQSTGLRDKNGKEIFEGDILTTGERTGVVKKHLTLGFYMNDARGDNWWFGSDVDLAEFEDLARDVAEKIEILGNIYTNPELAEVSS